MARSFWLSLAFISCSSVQVPASRRPDGSWRLQCGSSLAPCVQRAAEVCKDRGYVVLGGMSKRQLYGAELGVSQVAERQSELAIACADRRGQLPTVLSSSPAPRDDPPPASVAHTAACTPGATQRCVGAGACAGGQACLADGLGYAACDCGTTPAKAP
jgi:hypothetical protein